MHIILFLIIIALVCIIYFQSQNKRSGEHNSDESEVAPPLEALSHQSDQTAVAPQSSQSLRPSYISHGKLFQKNEQGETVQLHSKHVQELVDRMERSKQRHGWKQNTTWETNFIGMQKAGMQNSESLDVRFTSLLHLDEARILYFLQDASFGGLFLYDKNEDKELRLIHKQNLSYSDLSEPNGDGMILCSSAHESGIANIVMMDQEGAQTRELTGGDTIDSAPAWVKSDDKKVVFQSQGLARSQEGYVVACGPASLNMLNTENGELSTIFSNDNLDFLKPQVTRSGELYFIRRPYEAPGYGHFTALADVVMFPFRLLRALFHYLNFFSLMYSRKPLTSASGPQVQQDLKEVLIKGKRIEAEKALKKERCVNGVPSLVPSSWELVHCDQQGRQQVVARNVSSFYIGKDDEIIFTNGCGVFHLDGRGESRLILKDKLIEEIAC